MAAGVGVACIPYVWVLFALWESPSLFRTTNNGYGDWFYDIQARALFHGHLYVPNGSIGAEAFVNKGHQYMYFGLFPALLRMPILIVTHSMDGRLTAGSMFIAWILTGLFSALLIWRVRILIRGSATLGRVEAVSLGVLIATLMSGSVLIVLAADPYVYSEDLAWSVAMAIGSFFALLGVLERPSSGRVAVCGVLVLAAYDTRATTGLACVLGALLVAAWFALGREGAQKRRWWVPMFVIGLVPIMIGCAISWAKFGQLFGFRLSNQIAAATFGTSHFKDFSIRYVPTTIHAYFQPDGLQFSNVFPYITTPPEIGASPNIHIDPTASLTASMPLLFLLGVWGTVCVVRPRSVASLSAIRLVLVAAAAGCGVVLIFDWILERYLADFLPLLILVGAVGIVDVWRRLNRSQRGVRVLVLVVISVLGLFSLAANFGIATSPSLTWSRVQARNYVEVQKSISDITGHPLEAGVTRGAQRPIAWAPRGQLYIVGDCSALYLSNELGRRGVPTAGWNWMLVEKAPDRSLCSSLAPHR
jgi:hypothetical protein